MRFEEEVDGDNTALNGLRLKFCKYGIVKSMKVKYDTSNIKIASAPETLDSTIVYNPSKVPVTKKVEVSKKLIETSSFENMYGASLGVSVKAECGVPLLGKSEVTISAEMKIEIKKGGSYTTEKSITKSIDVTVPPCTNSVVTFDANKGHADIPYEATITFEDDSVSIVKGIWDGMSYSGDQFKIKHTALPQGECE